jgi:hypothetical protein
MKTLDQKIFNVQGLQVAVDAFDPDPSTPQITLVAVCGGTRLVREYCVGGTDPTTMASNVEPADEQTKLDRECQRLAELAARAERARLAKDGLR